MYNFDPAHLATFWEDLDFMNNCFWFLWQSSIRSIIHHRKIRVVEITGTENCHVVHCCLQQVYVNILNFSSHIPICIRTKHKTMDLSPPESLSSVLFKNLDTAPHWSAVEWIFIWNAFTKNTQINFCIALGHFCTADCHRCKELSITFAQ